MLKKNHGKSILQKIPDLIFKFKILKVAPRSIDCYVFLRFKLMLRKSFIKSLQV